MPELPVALGAVLTFLITNGVKAIAEMLNIDVSGWLAALVAAIVGSLMFFGNAILAALPPDSQQLVLAVAGLIVLVFSSFGIHKTAKQVAGA